MRNNSVKLFEFEPVGQEKISLKDISSLELWQPFCFVEWNHCAILVEGIMKKNSVKLF